MRLLVKVIGLAAIIGIVLFIISSFLIQYKNRIDLDKAPQRFDFQMKMYYIGNIIRHISICLCFVVFICLIIVMIRLLIRKP